MFAYWKCILPRALWPLMSIARLVCHDIMIFFSFLLSNMAKRQRNYLWNVSQINAIKWWIGPSNGEEENGTESAETRTRRTSPRGVLFYADNPGGVKLHNNHTGRVQYCYILSNHVEYHFISKHPGEALLHANQPDGVRLHSDHPGRVLLHSNTQVEYCYILSNHVKYHFMLIAEHPG